VWSYIGIYFGIGGGRGGPGGEEGILMDSWIVGEACGVREASTSGHGSGAGGGVESGEVFESSGPGGGGVDERWVEGDSPGRVRSRSHFLGLEVR